MLPHSKKDVKMDAKDALQVINEIAEMKSCNNCIYFETRKVGCGVGMYFPYSLSSAKWLMM